MLQVQNVRVAYGPQTVLEDVTLQLNRHSRIGLVGRNGGGKSTLLRLMMGEVTPDGGRVTLTPGVRLNCLTQDPKLTHGRTLREELNSAFVELNAAQAEEAALLATMPALSEAEQGRAAVRLATLRDIQTQLGGDDREARISRLIQGLGFSLDELERRVEHFSGGWQMRINLAKVLLQGADMLLLDEPTNHLDLAACEWLENFLKGYPGGLVIVSHDRRFLDAVVTEVAALSHGELRLWAGNYSDYVRQRDEEHARLTSAAERQQKHLAEQMAFVDRFRASATKSKQAKSREKQLAKIERIEPPELERQRVKMAFPVPKASGREVLTLRDLRKGFGGRTLFQDVNALIEREQRVFLLGENGAGKTTLLRLLLGLVPPDAGEVLPGHQVSLGYYAQDQLQTLNPERSLYDTLEDLLPTTPQSQIRALLGRFLFTGDEVFKPVKVLSGGEKGRLALAKLLVQAPNTLLLDEPTNHLDIPAQEAVTEALQGFPGTIICISHDRYFIQQLATHIWEIHDGRLITFDGSYKEYLRHRDTLRAQASAAKAPRKAPPPPAPEPEPASKTSPLRERRELEKQLKQTERQIVTLEAEKIQLTETLHTPEVAQDFNRLDQVGRKIQELEARLVSLNAQWESLAEQLS